MALIIKCRGCKRRVPKNETACPDCGSTDFRFIIDYWPRGRHGGRRHLSLPEDTRTVEQARELEQAYRSARTAKRTLSAAASLNSTVADLFPEYLKWYKLHRAPTTCRDINLSWEASLGPILGEYPIREIAGEHFSLYQQSRKAGLPVQEKIRKCRLGRVASNRTINKELDYFGGFLTWCRRMKRIETGEVHYEKLPCNRPLPFVLSPEEVSRIMKAAEREPFYRAFFLCLYALGFRLNEVRWLRMEDFDFENRAVKVKQKGGTEKILPLSDQVIEAVKDLAKLWPMAPGEYLFALKKTGAPVGDIRAAIKRICKAAGVTKKVTPHLFRHSIATHLMGADVNMRTIQQYLGHSQIATTEFYTHVALGHLRSAQDLISGGIHRKRNDIAENLHGKEATPQND